MIFTDLSKINDLLPYMSLRIGKALAYSLPMFSALLLNFSSNTLVVSFFTCLAYGLYTLFVIWRLIR